MGKSSRPLYFLVDPAIFDWEEWRERESQGHTVRRFGDSTVDWGSVDVIVSPRAWLMDEQHRKYLPLALAEARKRRYPKESNSSE